MLCACAGIRQAGAFGSTGGRSGMSKASTSSDCGGDGASRAPDSSPCIHMSRTVNASVTTLTGYHIPGGKNSRTLMSVSNQLSVCCSVGESFAILARASARAWYMAVASRRMRGSATPSSSSSSVASGDAMEETVMESRLRMEVSIEDANPGPWSQEGAGVHDANPGPWSQEGADVHRLGKCAQLRFVSRIEKKNPRLHAAKSRPPIPPLGCLFSFFLSGARSYPSETRVMACDRAPPQG